MILRGPAPSSLVHEERIGGRVVCRRRIPVVRLWRMDPARRYCGCFPRGATLPVSWSGSSRKRLPWGRVWSPGVKRRSRAEGLRRVARKVVAEGRAAGRRKVKSSVARSLCAELVKQHRAAILSVVAPALAGLRRRRTPSRLGSGRTASVRRGARTAGGCRSAARHQGRRERARAGAVRRGHRGAPRRRLAGSLRSRPGSWRRRGCVSWPRPPRRDRLAMNVAWKPPRRTSGLTQAAKLSQSPAPGGAKRGVAQLDAGGTGRPGPSCRA